ncbi:enoyl-CoA hydratase/isomerase family protein [Streptomyces sp. NPDC088194]|uniref:enoyl-CoA hydratase/isomerase family protein n=1 Tax=Streptomyces sp. NPDC088194 TaxID=3154931 RepID=UPI00344EE837
MELADSDATSVTVPQGVKPSTSWLSAGGDAEVPASREAGHPARTDGGIADGGFADGGFADGGFADGGIADGRELPTLSGAFGTDRQRVSRCLVELVRAVDALPPKAKRSQDPRRRADGLHQRARLLRRRFLDRHAERLYEELTDGLTRSLRVEEIAVLAAERCPGLVPGPERLAAEARLPQWEKEGWEIDQGLLFQALFGSAVAGPHLLRAMLRPTRRSLAALPGFRATGRADLGTVSVTRREGIAQVEVCNDAYLNAEDDALVEALETATDLVLLDDGSRVGVLRGGVMTHPAHRGRRVFSAGINLTHLFQGRISLVGFMLRREVGYLAKFVHGLHHGEDGPGGLPARVVKPWVGAVDSFAIGGGTQILLALDRVVTAEDAWFSLPAMDEGLVPGAANLRLVPATGSRLSRQMIFWGRRLRAGDPAASWLCDQVVPAGELDAAVERAAAHLDNPAVAANKRMLAIGEEPEDVFRRYMAAYAIEQAVRMYSPDLIANLERTWVNRSRRHAAGA